MKYCTEYAVLLDLFVDGELPAEEANRVRQHLEDCPGCRAYVDDALALRAGFAELEDIEVPEGFAEGVMERIRRETAAGQQASSHRRRWAGTLAALAACCALVILLKTGPMGMNGGGAEEGAFVSRSMDTAAHADIAAGGGSDEARNDVAPASVMEMGGEDSQPAENDAVVGTTAGKAEESVPAESAGEPAAEERSAEANLESAGEQKGSTPGSDMGADMAPMAPMAAAGVQGQMTDLNEAVALTLTAEEAGNLLDELIPVLEDGMERRYALTQKEYKQLLEKLGRDAKATDSPTAYDGAGAQEESLVLVIVTGPF